MPERTYSQVCPVAVALDSVGDRWALLVVRDLVLGSRRYGQLLQGLPGCGTDVLTARLRALEAAGIVKRGRIEQDQRAVTYELTEDGQALVPVLLELARWGMRRVAALEPGAYRSVRIGLTALALDSDGADLVGAEGTIEFLVGDHAACLTLDDGHLSFRDGRADDDPVATITLTAEALYGLVRRQLDVAACERTGEIIIRGDRDLSLRLLNLLGLPISP